MATVDEVVYYGDMTYYDVRLDGTRPAAAHFDAQRLRPPGAGHRRPRTRGVVRRARWCCSAEPVAPGATAQARSARRAC